MDRPIDNLQDLKSASRWLANCARSVYSQDGEDGIVAKALSMLPATNRWCVEVGAWDGRYLSNTFNLVENMQYRVVLIEGDPRKYRSLCRDYPFKDRATFMQQFVGWSGQNSLDAILSRHPVPIDFDLLSIDVDGNDFHVWRAVNRYKPRLVLIEFNPTAANRLDYVQPADMRLSRGSSPAAMIRLGKEKGYELISLTQHNLLFVDGAYFHLFNIPDNSLSVMRDEDSVTTVLVCFDGYLIADGPAFLRWHGMKFKLKQVLPWALRAFPGNYNLLQKVLLRIWRSLH